MAAEGRGGAPYAAAVDELTAAPTAKIGELGPAAAQPWIRHCRTIAGKARIRLPPRFPSRFFVTNHRDGLVLSPGYPRSPMANELIRPIDENTARAVEELSKTAGKGLDVAGKVGGYAAGVVGRTPH